MDFDLMLEFYDCIEEGKSGFEYFPDEWGNSVHLGEKFKDYARLSSPDGSEDKIPFPEEIDRNYKGFLRMNPGIFNLEENCKIFVFVESTIPKYLQMERMVDRERQIGASFYHNKRDFKIERVYTGDLFREPSLKLIRRTLCSDFQNNKQIKVIQKSKNYFDIEFLKGKKKVFGFFLDGDNYVYHEGIVNAIKVSPEIFSDMELFKTYFSCDFFEGTSSGKNKKIISVKNCLLKWQNA